MFLSRRNIVYKVNTPKRYCLQRKQREAILFFVKYLFYTNWYSLLKPKNQGKSFFQDPLLQHIIFQNRTGFDRIKPIIVFWTDRCKFWLFIYCFCPWGFSTTCQNQKSKHSHKNYHKSLHLTNQNKIKKKKKEIRLFMLFLPRVHLYIFHIVL